jgi:hypothetical protein
MTTLQDRDQWPLAQQSPEEGRATQPLWPRRTIIRSLLAAPGGIAAFYAGLGPADAAERLASIPASAREKAMRRAMAVARGNDGLTTNEEASNGNYRAGAWRLVGGMGVEEDAPADGPLGT